MSAVALHEFLNGNDVYGSNIEETERTAYLRKLGIPILCHTPQTTGTIPIWL